jgi:voltage-gated potassium channel Kch
MFYIKKIFKPRNKSLVKMKRKGVTSYASGYGKGEITIKKLVFYNLLFFVPILGFILLSRYLAGILKIHLQTTGQITAQMLMLFFTLGLFFVIIPFIRKRENVMGVRYALIGFLIVAVGLTLPTLILKRSAGLLLLELPHIASYILLTFIYTPEVLGMDIDISKWFKHYKQILVILVYCSIVLLYVTGFGWLYFSMASVDPGAFSYSVNKPVEYPVYLYFSVISFTTIGYGDITPVSPAARLLVCTEALIGAIVNVIFIAILFVYISNFQAFIKELKKEEAAIEKLTRKEKKKG